MKQTTKYLRFITLGALLCFALTGCGSNNGSTSGNNKNDADNLAEDVGDNVGNAVEDVAKGAGDAIEDVGDSVGNAVDDLVGTNGFENYNDAHDYFLETMNSYHADAKFELRDEDRELSTYQEGSKGYRFNLYDTSKDGNGEKFGEFYVDAISGQIYQKDDSGNILEYPKNDTASSKKVKNNATNNRADASKK